MMTTNVAHSQGTMRYIIGLFSVPILCSSGFSPGARSDVRRVVLNSSGADEGQDPADDGRLAVAPQPAPLSTWFSKVEDQSEDRQQFFWSWRGHDVFLDSFASPENLDKPTVILAHGFAASSKVPKCHSSCEHFFLIESPIMRHLTDLMLLYA